MSEDKRKVHTDALETLGMIIDETAKRDAIHLAVEPVIAKETLRPGEHVTVDGKCSYEGSDQAVGIVDPFLDKNVKCGERFWLILYPRQITSLRHVWEHPKFPFSEIKISGEEIEKLKSDEPVDLTVEKSKKWIKDLINRWHEQLEGDEENSYSFEKEDLTYETLMDHADYWVMSEDIYPDYFNLYDFDEYLPYEFWYHYEIVRGKKVEEVKKIIFLVVHVKVKI